jgi:hypothetical protein
MGGDTSLTRFLSVLPITVMIKPVLFPAVPVNPLIASGNLFAKGK